jgi:3-oxoacyl-[acyl-carrier-protein] synthase II
MKNNRVVVTGLGVISPVGNDAASFWRSLKEGISGIDKLSTFDASAYDARIAGEIKDFQPQLYGLSRKDTNRMEKFVQYAIAAATQAVNDSGITQANCDMERIGVVVGSGIGSLRIIEAEHDVVLKGGPSRISPFLIPMLIVNEAAGNVAIRFGFKGPNTCVTTACASGSHAIGEAFRIIQRGDADAVVSGGTESCITSLGVGGFCALKALSTRNYDPKRASRP